MKTEKTNVMRILDQKKISYNIYSYEADDAIDGISVANKIQKNPDLVFKTLVTKAAKTYYVFMIRVSDTLDLKKAAKAVNEKSVEMIAVAEINGLTGYIRGGCSPIGMKKDFVTVIDSTCKENDKIIFSAGKIGYQVEMALADLIRVINPKVENVII